LPDGLFSNQKSKVWKILEGLPMEGVGMFYGHLVHFTVFCCILFTFGVVRGHLVVFSLFGILYQEKSGNPGLNLAYTYIIPPQKTISVRSFFHSVGSNSIN
jgi:hypothetical protein